MIITKALNLSPFRFVIMKLLVVCTSLLLFSGSIYSQIKIGSWRSHLPASQFQFVDHLGQKIFAANTSGVLVYDETDESLIFLSKINHLVDAGITSFQCSESNSICVVGYENGNLDLIHSDLTIVNQPALKNSFLVGNKSVNDITFSDTSALISTGIGFISLNLKTNNINADRKELYQNDRLSMRRACIYHDSIFFSTQSGVFKCELNNLFNDQPFEKLNFPANPNSIEQFFVINDELFVTLMIDSLYEGDSIYVRNGSSFSRIQWLAGEGIKHVETTNDSILITHPDRVSLYDEDQELLTNIFTYGDDSGMTPKQAKFYNKKILIADQTKGAVITPLDNQYNSAVLGISSPSSTQISDLTTIGNEIFALPGGSEFTFNRPIVHQFSEETWQSSDIITAQFSTLRNTNGIARIDNSYFISTEKVGIAQTDLEFQITELFDYTNSTIQDAEPNIPYDYCGITALASTKDGTLYALNNKVPNPLIIRSKNGQWLSTNFIELPSPKTGDLLATEDGFLVINMIDVGIIVYNTNNSPENLSDDTYRLLTTSPSSGNLPSGNITSLAIDRDNELWIGTDAGIAVIYSLSSVFNSNFDGAQKIIVNQEGYNGYLFETETVEAIAVDGANRKWIGTANSGLFLISADGQEQIHNFTSKNSPLLNNKIVDLTIHPTSGEVFIASEKGLISYRSDAITENPTDDEIVSFPNPVKHGYTGPIAIKNLANNSNVRITDQAGNLVFETTSLGGQAIWDGMTPSGNLAPSGVYLIFSVNELGNNGKTGKLMIIR